LVTVWVIKHALKVNHPHTVIEHTREGHAVVRETLVYTLQHYGPLPIHKHRLSGGLNKYYRLVARDFNTMATVYTITTDIHGIKPAKCQQVRNDWHTHSYPLIYSPTLN
jgi:hypothetical protein